MNFEEMLNAQDGAATHREKLPLGEFYKKLIDHKYRNVVQLKPSLADSLVFCEALRAEQKWNLAQKARQQMHFELHEDSSGIYELELEQGNFLTLAQLLNSNPAVVAGKGFVDQMVSQLMEITEALHSDGVYHLCFAPQNVFVRKSDNAPFLLCHGSFYRSADSLKDVFSGFEDYLAPEVKADPVSFDERSDVFSLGKLIAFLFDQGEIPFEYRQVVKKATADDPDKRYRSVADMRSALTAKRSTLRSAYLLVAALLVALVCVGGYMMIVPDAEDIEFVEPAPMESAADPFDEPFDPEMELLLDDSDTIELSAEDRMYQQKAEEIFRKRFAREADKTLSKVYDNDRMGSGEKKFMAGSQQMMKDLLDKQSSLAEEIGLSEEQARRIGQEIVNQVTEEKQKELTRKGYQKQDSL